MTDNIDNNEIYIKLGKINNTHYFIHTIRGSVKDNLFQKPISYEILNIMINDCLINSSDENVVIYEFSKKNTDIIYIFHKNTTTTKTILDDIVCKINLETTFENLINNLLSTDMPYLYVVKYDYEKKIYLTYNLPNENICENITEKISGNVFTENISKIIKIMSIKPI